MAKAQTHAHKLTRVKLGRKGFEVYKCLKPGCGYFIRTELVLGVICECWRCGRDIIMTQFQADLKKPHCRDCTRSYTRADMEQDKHAVDQLTERLEKEAAALQRGE